MIGNGACLPGILVLHSMATRRTFILAGIAGGAALAAAYWLRRGHDTPALSAASAPLARLDPGAAAIIAAIVPALLDGALPQDQASRAVAVSETVAGVARAAAALPPAAQKELAQLFALLDVAPARIVLAGVRSPWATASARRGRRVPRALARRLRRCCARPTSALHQLVFAAWYGNPRSWPAIGYAGPPALSG